MTQKSVKTPKRRAKQAAKRVMKRARKVTLPGTNVKYQSRQMASVIEEQVASGVSEDEIFPFG